jgi:hypothetical protein
MRIRRLRTVAGMLCWFAALWLAGCHTAQQAAPAELAADDRRADAADEAQGVAEASLGKQAEVLAHGNLALNGREQVLVVNRFSSGNAVKSGSAQVSPIFVTRAAVLENNGGKWSQILLCDEHLKNPNGYLGGSPTGRITGWRLEFNPNTADGLEMKFTPADRLDGVNVNADRSSEPQVPSLDVRWNKIAKRYQSFDQSHERYLSEVPSLDIPQSILK